MPFNPKELGIHIQVRRRERGITQENLAEAISVSPGYISQIERGLITVSLDTLQKLANSLECNIADFFQSSSNDAGQLSMLREGTCEDKQVNTIPKYIESNVGLSFCEENYPKIIQELAKNLSVKDQSSFCYILASYLLSRK